MRTVQDIRSAHQRAKFKAGGGKVTECPAASAQGAESLQRWRPNHGQKRKITSLATAHGEVRSHSTDHETGEAKPGHTTVWRNL